jgi:hypothetical protein
MQSTVERLLYILLLVVFLWGAFFTFRVAQIGQQLKDQADAIRTTQATNKADNILRQNNLEDYVKCLSLIRFDVPEKQLTTREGVSLALDKCARVEQ